MTPSARWLLSLPIYHVGGMAILYRAFVAGASVLLRDPRLSIGQAILEGRPSHMSVVSTQLRRILDELPSAPEGLETVLVGGGPIEAGLIGEAVRAGYPIRTTYGMTEFSSQIATSAVWNTVRESYSTGRPIDRTEIKLGPEGEILARGPTRFLGYRSLDGSLPKVNASQWFETGDLGRIDNGELVIVGRKDELFISGGENIQPEEIEARLLGIPGIQEAIVVPVPDSEFGFRPVAAVKWNAEPWSEEAVLDRLRLRLPAFKIPVSILSWPDSSSKSSDDLKFKKSRNAIKRAVMNDWNDRDRRKGPLGT